MLGSDLLTPLSRGFFFVQSIHATIMNIVHTLSKKLDDRISTWRFVEVEGKFCAIGGNYKLISYRSEAAMKKSIAWFASKGYATI